MSVMNTASDLNGQETGVNVWKVNSTNADKMNNIKLRLNYKNVS